jgi:hypothetical protein
VVLPWPLLREGPPDFGPPSPDGLSPTNNTPVEAAFYEVVKIGATLYGLTNNATISGRLKLPVEIANDAGQLANLSLTVDGSPLASSIHAVPFEEPVPLLTIDTT